jgi:preprotein translocase subunit SecF
MIDFVRNRALFYVISALLVVPGLISLVLPGGLRPGIDFTSGTLMTVQFRDPVEQAALREEFARIGHGEAIIQRSSETNTFVIRTRPLEQVGADAADLSGSERQRVQDALTARFGPLEVLSLDQVSPIIAEEIVRYAILAVAAASGCILLYLWWAFRGVAHSVRFGATAVVALIHDALAVLGIFSILGRFFPVEIESTFIVAILTIIGFSVHDTIVTFDRIRENSIRHAGEPFDDVVNHSITQTLARSVLTSMTVLLTLTVLLVFGGVTIRTFVLALLIGISLGTYSSIFFASMLLVSWQRGELNWLWPFRNRGRAAAGAPA